MNGGVLPSSARYASTPVCVTGGYYTWPCTAGQTVVGFLNEYNLDGYQNGIFKYQNTSNLEKTANREPISSPSS